MKNISIRFTLLFILLAFLQVWLFGNINLFGFATPLLYIYFLVKLPIGMSRNTMLILSFLMGFIIDIFGGTLGLNMLVMVLSGFIRYYFVKLFAPRDISDDCIPSFDTFGKFLFMRYAGLITLIHVSLLYLIESLSLFNPILLLLNISSSFILTFILIFAFESLNLDVFNK